MGLRLKFSLMVAPFLALIMALLGVIGYQQQRGDLLNLLKERSQVQLKLLVQASSAALFANDFNLLVPYQVQFERDEDIVYAIVYDKEQQPFMEVKAGKKGEGVLELSQPVVVGQEALGSVVMGFSLEKVNRAARKAAMTNILQALLTLLLLVGLIYVVFTKVALNPLQQIAALTRSIAAGDLGQRVAVTSQDEIGELGRHFNQMTERLQELIEKGKEGKERLEEQVRLLSEVAAAAAKGDLTKEAPEGSSEEMGRLAASVNVMVRSLRSLIHQIREAGLQVSSGASEILAAAEQHASGSAEQAASVSEVTATLEELSATARQIAGSTEAVERIAEETAGSARAGSQAVLEAVRAMEGIRGRVEEIAKKTLALGERSQQIGAVLELIKEVAGEIHLLALNAAIESAAAGEHGRRFAVVAAEVRRLAERTRASTEEIRGIIGEIQAATNSSVLATEQGMKEVEAGAQVVKRAGGALEEILGMVERTAQASKQIAMATQQQRSASEQIVATMRELAEVIKQTAVGMQQSTLAAAELNKLADQLKERISEFKV